MRDVLRKLGYSTTSGSNSSTVKKRIQEYNIDISHFRSCTDAIKRTDENTFIENSTAGQSVLRRRYENGNFTPYICAICGLPPIWNNQPLTLILDHKNGLNHDDRLENLRWVCPNCNQQLPTTGNKRGIKYVDRNKIEGNAKPKKKNYCIDCGKKISKNAIRCIKCSHIHSKGIAKINKVTRSKLKERIRSETFESIAKEFNTTRTSIQRWCKKYELPWRKSDIKKYSDEEWSKL